MIKQINTYKFEGLAVLVPDDADKICISHNAAWYNLSYRLPGAKPMPFGWTHNQLPDCKWEILGKATELTEEQCAEIAHIGMDYHEPAYKNYISESDAIFKYPFGTAKESFSSFMDSIECYSINPYSDPKERYRCRDCADSDGLCCNEDMIKYCDPHIHLEKYNEAQKNTGTWLILKKL